MIPRLGSTFLPVIAGFLCVSATVAHGQALRTPLLRPLPAAQSSWSNSVSYGITTDYADNRTPRGYTQTLLGNVGYKINSHWSLGADISARAETIKGQISKDDQQSYSEVLSPSTSLGLSYDFDLTRIAHSTTFLYAEPLWDEGSQREGYTGILGLGSSLNMRFFKRVYSFGNTLTASKLLNSYRTNSEGNSNPEYFFSYKMVNALYFLKSNRLAYSFGVKLTHYLDDYTGYSYNNSISLSHSWNKFSLTLAYTNGGFTDNGEVSMWYIDEYRRLVTLSATYAL